jgi:hypothetical protein
MRRTHEDDSHGASSNIAETTLVQVRRDAPLFHDQTAETVCNKKEGTLSLVRAAIGYGIG